MRYGIVAGMLFAVLFTVGGMSAQVAATQTSGIDISGSWTTVAETGVGGAAVMLTDYGGVPFNEAGRLYALTWDPSHWTSRQQQCMAYEPTRLLHGGGNDRFWEDRDPFTQKLIDIKMYGQITEGTRTIWMDGRPHPPAYAKHSFLGFSPGKYVGNVLTVFTTHLKRNYIRTNGVAMSDQATLVEHFMRHGDILTYTSVITDPVYLAEPLIRTSLFRRNDRDPDAWLYACDDGEQIIGRAPDQVPAYQFGANPYLREYADKYKIPLLGAMGGAESQYPEMVAKLKDRESAEAAAKTVLFPSAGPQQVSKAVDPDPHDGQIQGPTKRLGRPAKTVLAVIEPSAAAPAPTRRKAHFHSRPTEATSRKNESLLVREEESGSEVGAIAGPSGELLVRCPGHSVIASDPSDNYETESDSADDHRRTAERVEQVGAVADAAGRGCFPGAFDSRLGGGYQLQQNHADAADDGAHHLALEAALRRTRNGGSGRSSQREPAARGHCRRASSHRPQDAAEAFRWLHALVLPKDGGGAGVEQIDGAASMGAGTLEAASVGSLHGLRRSAV